MVQTVEDQTSDHVRYRVVVRGLLGEHSAGLFDQLEVDPRPGQTSLTGNFADQAQLHGLLNQRMISRTAERPQHPGARHANHPDTETTDHAQLAAFADVASARLLRDRWGVCRLARRVSGYL
jgi:hypothetical protein